MGSFVKSGTYPLWPRVFLFQQQQKVVTNAFFKTFQWRRKAFATLRNVYLIKEMKRKEMLLSSASLETLPS